MGDKDQVIQDTKMVIKAITNLEEIDKQINETKSELEIVSGLVQKLVRDNSSRVQNQNEYAKKYEELSNRYEAAKEKLKKLESIQLEKKAKAKILEAVIAELEKCESELNEWSDDIWMLVCECGVVHHDGTITFRFRSGHEITE